MIRNIVIVDYKPWKKKIPHSQSYFDKVLKKFPRKYKFNGKKVIFSLLLSDNSEIKKLNQKFRNMKKHTDVLSFPFICKNEKKKIFKKKEIYLGDIIISYQYIYGKKFKKNKNLLINTFVHGFLHLLGYDHIKNKDYKKMIKEEENITKNIRY